MTFDNPIKNALKILARKRASSEEIRKRLIEKGFNKEEIDKAILYLKDSSYLNDEELLTDRIREFVENRFYGPEKIVELLTQKGFRIEKIKEKLSEMYDDETLIRYAHKFLKKKFGKIDKDDKRQREKIFRSLSYRGFDWDIIERILNI